MNLKTLKDLAKEADELSFGGYTIDTLKQEAIKDIKEYKKVMKDVPSTMKDVAFGAVVDYIKWKFNITKEDLLK